jgi:hypothetical protein
LIGVRPERRVDSRAVPDRVDRASTLAVLVPSIRHARRWEARVVPVLLGAGPALVLAPDLADHRVQALAAPVRVAPAEHRRQPKRDVLSARLRVAVLVDSSSIRRPRKVR